MIRNRPISSLAPSVLLLASLPLASGQSASSKILLEAEFKPGQTLRYELEAAGSFLPIADASGAILTPPRGPCDYTLHAIATLRPQPADTNGNTPVEATYSEVRVTSFRCGLFSAAEFQKKIAKVESAPAWFRVGPHGETGAVHDSAGRFKYWDADDLLRKITQDLLQTQFSVQPVSEGDSWKPRGQFAYSGDSALADLELSGADLRFRKLLEIEGRSCAWLTSQYVFSPVDLPAVGTASGGGTIPAAGNNAVAAVLHISMLLDPASRHIAWLHRSQVIDNKLTLASPYDDSDPQGPPESPSDESAMPDLSSMRSDNPGRYPFMTFHFQEEARARLLPEERSIEWLAALKRFESTPEPESETTSAAIPRSLLANPITQAAKPAVVKRSTRPVIDSDSLLPTPTGFRRYEKVFCRDSWFCATVSVALPGEIRFLEDTPLHTVYLSHQGDVRISVAIGPALDRNPQGLTEPEELEKQSKYYLANYVWLANKPGIGTSSGSATLDGYPGLITDFHATQRNLANIHGVLGLILTPWGQIVPVACSSDQPPAAELQAVCEKVIASVSLRR